MCGLAGRFHPVALPDAGDWHVRADRLLAHRGPDGAGHIRDTHCELVHRRLAIVDLSPCGAQPMSNEDGSVQVVFNGEIYNHRLLRRVLEQRGHVFRSRADTEVLVHLYEECGERLAERLRGIFAFAIYDRRRRRLVLGRDRYGVKPLFYTSDAPGGQWVFASELKAICALPGFRPAIDRQACYDFLGLSYVPEPATGFAGIRALPRGSVLTVTAAGHREARYHQTAARPSPARTLAESADVLDGLLRDAVARQSAADVPVAALLSGGIDSALVVAAHRRATGAATTTFNVQFPDPDHDETDVARAVAEQSGTKHHTIDARERSLTPEAIMDLLRHFDQPFADTSYLPTYWVSSAVRERGIVCTLSGDGGDEVFGGYARFWRVQRLVQLMRAPGWLRRAAGAVGRTMAPHSRSWGRQLAKAAALADAGGQDSSVLLAGFGSYLTEDQKADLLLPEGRERLLPGHRHFDGYWPPGTRDLEELSVRVTETLFALSLPSDMLRKVDMMSMRAGIEVRVPLLDEELVAFGLALPHALKADGRQGKLVLRELARRWLPSRVARHPKHGFTIPLDIMVPPAFHDAVEDLLCGSDARTGAFVRPEVVRAWIREFAAARAGGRGGTISRGGLYQRVFMLLSLELWLRDHGLSW